jgi:hypothetical protein
VNKKPSGEKAPIPPAHPNSIMSTTQQLNSVKPESQGRSLMGQAESVDKKIVEEEQMNNV